MSAVNDPNAGDGRARRWAGQRAKRRREAVDAALQAVAMHGADTTAEQIAASAGIPRPRLYRYFSDADELHDAVATRLAELVTEAVAGEFTVPADSPSRVIARAVDALVAWLVEHPNWYRYIVARPAAGRSVGVLAGIETAIGRRLSDLLTVYAELFGIDTRVVDPCAFALVGMVESAATRWLDEPGGLGRAELVDRLSHWCWCLIDQVLRAGGVTVDPDEPLPALPAVEA